MDIDKLMKLDLSYPGISFGYHSWSLGIYIESLEDFISHAADQYRLRAKRELPYLPISLRHRLPLELV